MAKQMNKGKTVCLETISPAIAEIYLKRNCENNRKLKEHIVNEYANDMRLGNWEVESPANTISFDIDGRLVNGQHRLKAVIKAGVPVDMWVWRDVPKNIHNVDNGVVRSTSDILQMRGLNRDITNTQNVAIVRKVTQWVYKTPFRWTDDMIGDYLSEFGYDVYISKKISDARVGKIGLTRTASCQTAIYVAYRYGMHEDDLREFCKICTTGIQNHPWQTAPVHLRNFILGQTGSYGKSINTYNYQKTLFMLTNQALWDYYGKKARKLQYRIDKLTETIPVEFVRQTDKEFIERITGSAK